MKLRNASVEKGINEYLKTPEFKIKIRSDKTRSQYIYQLRKLCNTKLDDIYVGAILIKDLNVAKCQAIYWQLITGVTTDTGGVHFANYSLQIVTRAWNVLIKYDCLDKNSWSFVERSKPSPRNTVWQPADIKTLLQTAFSVPKWRNIGLLFRINIEIGQRIEDIRLSQWENYNLSERLYMREVIQKTLERIPGIPMSDSLTQMLIEQKQVYDFQKWVVPHPFSLEPYSENNISKIFRTIMSVAKLPSRLQLRDIRRTVLTDLANHGATDVEIMAYSGHKSRESLRPYICISTDQARNAASKRNFNLQEDIEREQFTHGLAVTKEIIKGKQIK